MRNDLPSSDDAPSIGGRADPMERRARAERVSRDMEGIFGAAPAPGADTRHPGERGHDVPDAIVPIRGRTAKGRRRWAIGLPLLVLCGAALGGSTLWWMAFPAPRPTSGPAAHKAIEVAQAPRPAQPQALLAAAPIRPSPAPAATANDATGPGRTGPPAAAPRKANVTAAPALSHRPMASASQHARAQPARDDGNGTCEGLDRLERSRCMRPQLLRADEQLRTAYARATRAGVASGTLKSYRRRWARLLEKSISDPEYVTLSLRVMARQLDEKRDAL